MCQGAAKEGKVSWEFRLTARQAGVGSYQQSLQLQSTCAGAEQIQSKQQFRLTGQAGSDGAGPRSSQKVRSADQAQGQN